MALWDTRDGVQTPSVILALCESTKLGATTIKCAWSICPHRKNKRANGKYVGMPESSIKWWESEARSYRQVYVYFARTPTVRP